MLFNAKNMQIDTEKIQQVIDESGKYWFDTDSLIREGLQGFPILASFGLATITLPEKDNAGNDKGTKPSVLENIADKIMDIGNTAKNAVKKESAGPLRKVRDTIEINCSYGTGNKAINFPGKEIHRLSLTNAFSDFFMNDLMGMQNMEVPRYIKRAAELATEIRDQFFSAEWRIAIDSNIDLTDYMGNINLFYLIEDALTEIKKRLSAGKINKPTIHYIALEDVTALNIIKIIDKGTDKEANFYTGRCSSIVIEALVNGKYNIFSGIQLLKTIIKANAVRITKSTYSTTKPTNIEVERFDSSYIVNSNEVKNVMCTRYICTEFVSIDTMGSLKDTLEAEKNIPLSMDDDTEKEERYSNSNIIIFEDSLFSQFDKCLTNEIVHLIVPNGMMLSDSFKAKYI